VSADKEQSRQWIDEFVIHAIVAQWPDWCPSKIEIQQDNETPHISKDDADIAADTEFYGRTENGKWDVTLYHQPPNSPNMNILNLAMF
jgi:hypothetical protein